MADQLPFPESLIPQLAAYVDAVHANYKAKATPAQLEAA